MMWFLANWRLFAYGSAVVACLVLGWNLRGHWDQEEIENKLNAQKSALVSQCDNEKKITQEVSNDYQTKISLLNKRLSSLRVRSDNKHLPASIPASGYNASPRTGIDAGSPFAADQSFIEYGGQCEQFRLQIISLQDFIVRERQ